jgi:hypothetical protein
MEYTNKHANPNTPSDSLEKTHSPTKQEVEILSVIDGVHLGKTESGQYIDDVRARVPEAGIGVRVWQNSIGATGIEAVALAGNAVEAAAIDDSGNLVWHEHDEDRDGIEVSSVWGNVGELPVEELTNDEQIGNAGLQWGVVRVTEQDGSRQHFLVAAEFTGVADNWKVRAEIAAIAPPQSAAELQALQLPQLPPS